MDRFKEIVRKYLEIIEGEHNKISCPEDLIYSEQLEKMEEIKLVATERAYKVGILNPDPIVIDIIREQPDNFSLGNALPRWKMQRR